MALTSLTNLQPLHVHSVGVSTFDGSVSVGGTLTYEDVTNVDAIGIVTARSGVNVSGGQLDVGNNIKLGNAGVITATSFVGDGSGLTGAGPSLTGSTNNTIVTVTGANAIQGESNLTFDGTDTLEMGTAAGGSGYDSNMKLRIGRGGDCQICVRNTGGDSNYGGLIFGDSSSSFGGGIQYHHNGNSLRFYTDGNNERLRITGDGAHLLLGGTADVNEITESSSNIGIVIGNTSLGNGGLAIVNSTSGTGRIYFGDAVGANAARNRGQINYYHNGDYMIFATAGSPRLHITSDGKVVAGGSTGAGYPCKLQSHGAGDLLDHQHHVIEV